MHPLAPGIARTFPLSKVSESQARGEAIRNVASFALPFSPFARSVFQPKDASARFVVALPGSPKSTGAPPPNSPQSRSQATASASDSAAIRARVSPGPVETPHHVPSGRAEAKGRSTGTKTSP